MYNVRSPKFYHYDLENLNVFDRLSLGLARNKHTIVKISKAIYNNKYYERIQHEIYLDKNLQLNNAYFMLKYI